jgi:hypothetical protein
VHHRIRDGSHDEFSPFVLAIAALNRMRAELRTVAMVHKKPIFSILLDNPFRACFLLRKFQKKFEAPARVRTGTADRRREAGHLAGAIA